MTTTATATPGVDVISTTAEVPGLGCLAVNAFVLHGDEPVLVDTGTVAGSDDFMAALRSVIDPAELSRQVALESLDRAWLLGLALPIRRRVLALWLGERAPAGLEVTLERLEAVLRVAASPGPARRDWPSAAQSDA